MLLPVGIEPRASDFNALHDLRPPGNRELAQAVAYRALKLEALDSIPTGITFHCWIIFVFL